MKWSFKRKAPAKKEVSKPVTFKVARGFDLGDTGRLTSSWMGVAVSIDSLLRRHLPRMQWRSRDLARNDEYARKYLQMCQTHVVGPTGFTLQVAVMETDAKGVKKADQLAGTAIEDAFYRWARKGSCEVTGKLSFFDICNIALQEVPRDGEWIARKVYGSGAGPFGFQLQLLTIDRLDVNKNELLGNGNVIKMGVELTPYGRPVAYFIRTRDPNDNSFHAALPATYERVPAEDIYHLFRPEYSEQTRGVPWMSSSARGLQDLGGFEESAVVAARIGASNVAYYKTPDGDAKPLAEGEDANGNLETSAEPGTFLALPPGVELQSINWTYPAVMVKDFIKAALRRLSSGLGVAYNTLSNDLEGVNFSSIRTGVLEERDNWMTIQNWFVEAFLNDLFSTWLKWALVSGQVTMPNGSALPASKFDKFNVGVWQGRRWQWVDPRADVESNISAIENCLKTRSDAIAEQGKDPAEVFRKLKEESELLRGLGLLPPAGQEAGVKPKPKPKTEEQEKPKESEAA